jgi:hypothetical protein
MRTLGGEVIEAKARAHTHTHPEEGLDPMAEFLTKSEFAEG